MAKNGRVATLNMRSEAHNEIIKGVNVCSLVFLWYITEAMTSTLNVKPPTASNVATHPPKCASKELYRKSILYFSAVKLSFNQQVVFSFIGSGTLVIDMTVVEFMFVLF